MADPETTTGFLSALNLPLDTPVEDISVIFLPLVISAIHDNDPQFSLDDINRLVTEYDGHNYLEALDIFRLLVPCPRNGAEPLLRTLATQLSAKEVTLATQEHIESIKSHLADSDSDLDSNSEPQEIFQNEVSLPIQLVRVFILYQLSIPRLRLRQKSPYDIIHPLLSDLVSIVDEVGGNATKDEGRALIYQVSRTATDVYVWVTQGPKSTPDDVDKAKTLLAGLIDATVVSCVGCIQSSLAERSFEAQYPRLVVKSSVNPDWESGENITRAALDALTHISIATDVIPNPPTFTSLIYTAHSPQIPTSSLKTLTALLPIFVSSLQSNLALDESFSLLITLLSCIPADTILPDTLSTPLCQILPALASTHPAATSRHIAFRLLSRLLTLSSPPLRLQVLLDLTSKLSFPQMRMAAVGLLKEAVVEALAAPESGGAVFFGSPVLLKAFGGALFRTTPPDFLSGQRGLDEIRESMEPGRLVECLSLYYVLLQRDTGNRTGVRDQDGIANVRSSLLNPLHTFLQKHEQVVVQLIALRVSLDRVEDALKTIESL